MEPAAAPKKPEPQAANAGSDDDGADQDTCRICRGEATEQDPLFYPCKCSGSIKYVHQGCLMEWLGHSQKKHCELCKTPFRFTKLYSPNMPSTLPFHVFLRHLGVRTVKNMGAWLRMFLVMFVWLVVLPWMMRHIWGLLFWLADGGRPTYDPGVPAITLNAEDLEVSRKLAVLAANGTSPANPLLRQPTTSPVMRDAITTLWEYALMQRFDVGIPKPSIAAVLSSFLKTVGLQDYSLPSELASGTKRMLPLDPQSMHKHSSLLGNVRFLNSLTRSRWLNNFVITCLEGQIITILVIVSFILIFLIREWVVQQQPGINMGAGFEAEFPNGPRPGAHEVDVDVHDAEHGNIAAIDRIIRDVEELQGAINRQTGELNEEPAAPPERMVRFDEDQSDGTGSDIEDRIADESHLDPTATAEQQPVAGPGHQDVTEFMSLWRRANEDPRTVLRLMDEEGLSERLGYWKNALLVSLSASDSPTIVETINSRGAYIEPDGQPHDPNTASLPVDADTLPRPTKTRIITLDPSQQKQAIGETLYPKIKAVLPELAGKVTGMLLEMDNSILLDLVDDTRALYIKMDEALLVYDAYLRDNDIAPVLNTEPGKEAILTGLLVRKGKCVGIKKSSKLAEMMLNLDIKDILELVRDEASFRSKAFERMMLYELHLTNMRGVFANDEVKDQLHDDDADSALDRTYALPQVSQDTPSTSRASSLAGEPSSSSGSGRPRSVSDGAHISVHRSPLAGDYWTPLEEPLDLSTIQDFQSQGPIPGIESELEGRGLNETSMEGSPDESRPQADIHEAEPEDQSSATHFEGSATGSEQTTAEPHEDDHPDEHPPAEDNPAPAQPAPQQRVQPEGLMGHVINWIWGDLNIPANEQDDEHIVEDLNAEDPFVRVGERNRRFGPDVGQVDADNPEDVIAAVLAEEEQEDDQNDPDADDAEDLDGIMELVGMHGPVTSLVQNALLGAVLISLTLALGVWVPYAVGKLSLLLLANPISAVKLPLRLIFKSAAVMQDLAAVVLGGVSYAVISVASLAIRLLSNKPVSGAANTDIASDSLNFASLAYDRILTGFVSVVKQIPDSEIPAFSAASHEALNYIKSILLSVVGITRVFNSELDTAAIRSVAAKFGSSTVAFLYNLPATLAKHDTWVISLSGPSRTEPLDLALSYWNGLDRFWAIATGYLTFVFFGAAYIRKGSPFSSSQSGREWEATLVDVLNQTGGVMKVILIISIEMLAFPLYCGLLLDVATLPLFDKATPTSRMDFAVESPWTSMFVHWFVGTCYMFHFALFVSMCRKILRNGVLYFIRDPDDPTFHPVRDVLERSVATQLRKIAFSAMIYGALVLVCLGGVVWGLAIGFPGVLPIHWSSNEPVLEFPVDLLFYNYLMPVVVKYCKPSEGLHAMYTWWFKRCARLLRLTWFLLDERMTDEEGYFADWTPKDSLVRMQRDVSASEPFPGREFIKDGRYVRTPASDMVRIPKNGRVFLEVSESNHRLDGRIDRPDGVHGKDSKLFKMVYAPPWFRTRILAFIALLWLFAAVTGCTATLAPLVFGRWVFQACLPAEVKKNDIYAFSIGVVLLGGAAYGLVYLRAGIARWRNSLTLNAETMRAAKLMSIRALRLAYAYTAFVFVLPTLIAFVAEFYVVIPLHTYFAPGDPHTINFMQSWTVGLLFVNLARRCILWYSDSRPAKALRGVVRHGMLDPDIRLATRCFIFPITLCSVLALTLPVLSAWVANHFEMFGSDPYIQTLVYRASFPLLLAALAQASSMSLLADVVEGWRVNIRDEAYLIGERLHNFGESKRRNTGVGMPSMNRIEA